MAALRHEPAHEGLPPNGYRSRAAQGRDRGVVAVRGGDGQDPAHDLPAGVVRELLDAAGVGCFASRGATSAPAWKTRSTHTLRSSPPTSSRRACRRPTRASEAEREFGAVGIDPRRVHRDRAASSSTREPQRDSHEHPAGRSLHRARPSLERGVRHRRHPVHRARCRCDGDDLQRRARDAHSPAPVRRSPTSSSPSTPRFRRRTLTGVNISYPDYVSWRDESKSFAALGIWTWQSPSFTGTGSRWRRASSTARR